MTGMKVLIKRIMNSILFRNVNIKSPGSMEDNIDEFRLFLKENSYSGEFSPFFENKAMQKINELKVNEFENFAESLSYVFKPVALTASVIVIFLIVYGFSSSNSLSIDNPVGIPQPSIENIVEQDISEILE